MSLSLSDHFLEACKSDRPQYIPANEHPNQRPAVLVRPSQEFDLTPEVPENCKGKCLVRFPCSNACVGRKKLTLFCELQSEYVIAIVTTFPENISEKENSKRTFNLFCSLNWSHQFLSRMDGTVLKDYTSIGRDVFKHQFQSHTMYSFKRHLRTIFSFVTPNYSCLYVYTGSAIIMATTKVHCKN